jgi:hypothetical protein
MAYQIQNLLTKTIVSSNPEDQDAAVKEFQKDHTVHFSQSHVLEVEDKLRYIIILFYKEKE